MKEGASSPKAIGKPKWQLISPSSLKRNAKPVLTSRAATNLTKIRATLNPGTSPRGHKHRKFHPVLFVSQSNVRRPGNKEVLHLVKTLKSHATSTKQASSRATEPKMQPSKTKRTRSKQTSPDTPSEIQQIKSW
jgi:hypothetical protein